VPGHGRGELGGAVLFLAAAAAASARGKLTWRSPLTQAGRAGEGREQTLQLSGQAWHLSRIKPGSPSADCSTPGEMLSETRKEAFPGLHLPT